MRIVPDAAPRKGGANEAYQKRLNELGSLPPNDEERSAAYLQKFMPVEVEKFRALLAEKK